MPAARTAAGEAPGRGPGAGAAPCGASGDPEAGLGHRSHSVPGAVGVTEAEFRGKCRDDNESQLSADLSSSPPVRRCLATCHTGTGTRPETPGAVGQAAQLCGSPSLSWGPLCSTPGLHARIAGGPITPVCAPIQNLRSLGLWMSQALGCRPGDPDSASGGVCLLNLSQNKTGCGRSQGDHNQWLRAMPRAVPFGDKVLAW